MKAVVQRTLEAYVTINNIKVASITKGLLVLIGVEDADTKEYSQGKATLFRACTELASPENWNKRIDNAEVY